MEYYDVGTNTNLPQSDQRKYRQSVMLWEQALIYLTLTKERCHVVGTSTDLLDFDQRKDRWSAFISV